MVVTKAPSEPWAVLVPTLEAMLHQDFPYPYDVWLADERPERRDVAVVRRAQRGGVDALRRRGVSPPDVATPHEVQGRQPCVLLRLRRVRQLRRSRAARRRPHPRADVPRRDRAAVPRSGRGLRRRAERVRCQRERRVDRPRPACIASRPCTARSRPARIRVMARCASVRTTPCAPALCAKWAGWGQNSPRITRRRCGSSPPAGTACSPSTPKPTATDPRAWPKCSRRKSSGRAVSGRCSALRPEQAPYRPAQGSPATRLRHLLLSAARSGVGRSPRCSPRSVSFFGLSWGNTSLAGFYAHLWPLSFVGMAITALPPPATGASSPRRQVVVLGDAAVPDDPLAVDNGRRIPRAFGWACGARTGRSKSPRRARRAPSRCRSGSSCRRCCSASFPALVAVTTMNWGRSPGLDAAGKRSGVHLLGSRARGRGVPRRQQRPGGSEWRPTPRCTGKGWSAWHSSRSVLITVGRRRADCRSLAAQVRHRSLNPQKSQFFPV